MTGNFILNREGELLSAPFLHPFINQHVRWRLRQNCLSKLSRAILEDRIECKKLNEWYCQRVAKSTPQYLGSHIVISETGIAYSNPAQMISTFSLLILDIVNS
jgi:ERCC4-related helicase